MNADIFFAIGRTHPVCQDYACLTPKGVALADGCSQSPHSDFGARLLCRMAGLHGSADAAVEAQPLLESLALPRGSLNATLLTAEWREETASTLAFVRGDGVIAALRRDGVRITVTVEFPSGAPLYPSYEMDPAVREAWADRYGTTRVVTTYADDTVLSVEKAELRGPEGWLGTVVSREFVSSEFKLAVVASDGLQSFRTVGRTGGIEPIPVTEVVAGILAVKTFPGDFLVRRVSRFLRDSAAKGWHHDDDVSVAGIHMEVP